MFKTRVFAAVAMCLAADCSFFHKITRPHGDVPASCRGIDGIAVVTYNAGLAPGVVSYANARTPLVAQAVAAQDFDLLCLQEVWPAAAAREVMNGLALPPENVFAADTEGEGENGRDICTQAQFDGMASCVRERCANEPDDEVSVCAVKECRLDGVLLYLRARECLNCLIATAGSSLADVEKTCVRGGGASRIYGGRNGIILASRNPLKNTEALRLPASGANRVALFATVDTGTGPPLEVACTHLSVKSYVSPTNPAFSSWEDEQGSQIDAISARLAARANGNPMLLVGDLNTGPENGLVGDHMRKNWERLASLGYWSPAADAVRPFCTSCADNQLRGSDTNYLIDHVLVRRTDGRSPLTPACVERVFDDEVWLRPTPTRIVLSRRSDHYGLKVVFRTR